MRSSRVIFRRRWRLLDLAVLASLCAAPAYAVEATEKTASERSEARLVADAAVAAPGEAFKAAFVLKLADHWHSYWRNPGASGLEPQIEWTAPDGVSIGALQFPTPERIPFGGLVNFGFHDEAVHLIDIALPADWPPGEPLAMTASATWLVCKDVCVPEQQMFTLTVPTGVAAKSDPGAAEIVARGVASAPARPDASARFKRLEGALYRLEVDHETLRANGLEKFFFFAEDWRALEPSGEPRIERTATGVALEIEAAEKGFAGPLKGVLRAEVAAGAPVAIEIVAVEAPEGS